MSKIKNQPKVTAILISYADNTFVSHSLEKTDLGGRGLESRT